MELLHYEAKENASSINEFMDYSFTPVTRKKVLIVDSDPGSSSKTSGIMKFWGYDAEVSYSFGAALEALKSTKPCFSLVLVELRKIDDSTMAFPRAVRDIEGYKKAPIIARSSLKDRDAILAAISSGYTDYILRPGELDIFKDKVDAAISRFANIGSSVYPIPIAKRGFIKLDVMITSINEFGVEGYSNTFLEPDSIISPDSELLPEFNLESVELRVLQCERSDVDIQWKYKFTATFIGLSPRAAQSMRMPRFQKITRGVA